MSRKNILVALGVVLALGIVAFLAIPSYQDFGFKGPPAQKEFIDGKAWMLVDSMPYEVGSSGDEVAVLDGFVHDGASIPGYLHSIIHKNGRYSRPAIVHDYLYWTQQCTRKQSDNLLLIGMIETKVPKGKRWAIYKAVRIGGKGAWQGNARDRAAGQPRIVPMEYRNLPEDKTWSEYRIELASLGVKDPDVTVSQEFCSHGDSSRVPMQDFSAIADDKEIMSVMNVQ